MDNTISHSKNAKRKIVKGFVILLVVLLLCGFFSGTIRTLSTANVYVISPAYGNLTENIEATGFLSFSQTECVPDLDLPEGVAATVSHLYVASGMKVQKGDLLFEAMIQNENSLLNQAESAYQVCATELIDLQLKNQNMRITSREEQWLQTYDDYILMQMQLLEAKAQLRASSETIGIQLENDRLPSETEDPGLLELQAKVDYAEHDLAAAQSALEKAERKGVSNDARNYLIQAKKIKAEMESLEKTMSQLRFASSAVREVRALHDGYIIDVYIAENETFGTGDPVILMSSAQAGIVLSADVEEVSRSISVGTQVVIHGNGSGQVESFVEEHSVDKNGNTIIMIPIQEQDLIRLGGISRLMKTGTGVTVRYEAEDPSVQIPASAVRGSEGNCFVYVIQETENLLGQEVFTVSKQSIHVIDTASGMSSVTDDLMMDIRIATMEDRPISDGDEVMIVRGQ